MSANRARELIHRFIRVGRLHRNLIDSQGRALGIHHSQHDILCYLQESEKGVSQTELARRVGISPAAVTALLKKLEERGYVEKVVNPSDNRCNEIRITQTGSQVLGELRAAFTRVDTTTFAALSEDELRTFLHCLTVMEQNLSGMETKENYSISGKDDTV